jgi:hypothetical protein
MSEPKSHTEVALRWLFLLGVGGIYFLAQFRTGGSPAFRELDPSWTAVLAHGYVRGLAWGADIVFTYGPLGFLHPYASWYAPLYDRFLVMQYLLSIAAAVLAAAAFGHMGRRVRWLAAAIALSWLTSLGADVGWFLGFVFATLIVAHWTANSTAQIGARLVLPVLALVLLTLLTQVKFSLFPLWAFFMLAGGAMIWRAAGVGAALSWLMAGLAFIAGFWIAAGQTITLLPRFLALSFEVSAGYAQGMSFFPRLEIDLLGLALITITGALFALLALRNRSSLRALAAIAVLSAVIYIAWRSAYTRADAHVLIAYPVLALATLAAVSLPKVRLDRWLRHAFLALATVLTVAGHILGSGLTPNGTHGGQITMLRDAVRDALAPSRRSADFGRTLAHATGAEPFARIRERVGHESVDLLTYAQGVAIAHGLDLKLRPVFQSYAAYTPRLAELNRSFLASDAAPHYVLLDVNPIDGRYGAAEDGPAMLCLMQRYRPVLHEHGFLLLERRDGGVACSLPHWGPGDDAAVALGEFADLPERDASLGLVRGTVTLSLLGRIAAFVLREPILLMDLRYADGTIQTHRVLRGQLESGFAIQPAIVNTADFARAPYGLGSKPVALRLRTDPPYWRHALQSTHTLGFGRVDLQTPDTTDEPDASLSELIYSGFGRPYLRLAGEIREIPSPSGVRLFMHAPAEIGFDLPPGRHRIVGTLGILEEARTAPGCIGADGVVFEIALDPPGPQLAGDAFFRRILNPFADVNENMQGAIDVEAIEIEPGTRVLVRTRPGAAGHAACDWSYVSGLRFEPIAPGA